MIDLSMGATHVDHDKLVKIVNTIERQKAMLRDLPEDIDYSTARTISKIKQHHEYMMSKYNYGDARLSRLSYVPEVKYDGYSYLFTDGQFASRNLSTAKETKGQPIFKSDHVPHLTEVMKRLYHQFGIDIQGELFKPGGTSDDVTKVMGCTVDKAVERQMQNGKLHYMWIDIRKYFGIDVKNEPYWLRRALMENIFYNRVPDELKRYIHISEITMDAVGSFRNIVSDGGEGLVIKDTHRTYFAGKKPAGTWIKCKSEVTLDVVIMGYNPGTGKNKDMFGSLQVGLMIDGKLTKVANVSSGIEDDVRKIIAMNPEGYKGKIIEISAMQPYENKASFRHPRFKGFRLDSDKSAEQCTMDGIKINLELI